MENNSKSKITPYLYLVPCMLIFGIFLFYPFVKTIYLTNVARILPPLQVGR